MRIGVLVWLHESNTFAREPTTLERFAEDLLVTGDDVIARFVGTRHEAGGFLAAIGASPDAEAVPLAAFRAVPGGPLTAATFAALQDRALAAVHRAGRLDGVLVAVHGAAVAEGHPDADGAWLASLRAQLGPDVPIVGTLDAHANLSSDMVAACTALVAYRTNPHVDQEARGHEAARILLDAVRGRTCPVMAAGFPPLVIPIDRQGTDEPHFAPLHAAVDDVRRRAGILSASLLLGFPYADVAEMGAATIAVADGSEADARHAADALAATLWAARDVLRSDLVSVAAALDRCAAEPDRVCLLDMGDNVGGGSPGDGTLLAQGLLARGLGPAVVCLHDPFAVAACAAAGSGAEVDLVVGGRGVAAAGPPLPVRGQVVAVVDGTFEERAVRHGGIVHYDQGPTAVMRSGPLTLVLTSRRVPPFSLGQLTSCGLDPAAFRIIVAKGVHAPLAAYRDVCDRFLRVDTPGDTSADLTRFDFQRRRRPLFPFETR